MQQRAPLFPARKVRAKRRPRVCSCGDGGGQWKAQPGTDPAWKQRHAPVSEWYRDVLRPSMDDLRRRRLCALATLLRAVDCAREAHNTIVTVVDYPAYDVLYGIAQKTRPHLLGEARAR
jgi:hypothetical protein